MKRIAFLLCISSSITAIAQQKDSAELLPVEVKAVRAGATAPFAKTNIGKAEIERQNLGQDLPFLLNQTPSVVINSDAGNGVGYTGIHIRGTDATRINVTLNGIPYNDQESQGTYFVDLPDFASSVNNIQIQRGVGTSTNGAGAFGATINFNTNEVNRKAYGELNNSYGSFNTLKNTLKLGTGLLNNHFTADLRLSRVSSGGYIDRASTNLKGLYFSTAYLSNKTDLRFNFITGKEKTYQAWYGVSEADLASNRTVNYAGTDKPGSPYDNETDNYRQDHYQLFFTQRFTPQLILNTAVFLSNGKGYYEQYKASQKYSSYGMPDLVNGSDTTRTTDLVRQLWLDNHYYGDIFSLLYQQGKTSVTLGGAVTRYDGKHFGKVVWAEKGITGPKRYYENIAYKNDFNVYTKWQQDLTSSLQSFIDLQYRKVGYEINGFQYNPTLLINTDYNFFNPKAGLSYHQQNWLSYISYSVSTKEPNRDDFEAGMNEQPKPEQLKDLELGTEYKNPKASWGVNLFYMDYKDQLVLTGKINDVGSYTRTNIPKSYRLGVELQGALKLANFLKASANLTLSRNKIQNFTEFIDEYNAAGDYIGQKSNATKESDISFSPNAVSAATITLLPVKSLSIDLLNKYVSKQYLDNTSNESRKLNPYYTLDTRAVYAIGAGWLKNLEAIIQVNNVFNKKYEPNGYTFSYYYDNALTTENYYFPMAGTNWMIGLNLKF